MVDSFRKKINKEKGASVIELLLAGSVATLIIGGVSVNIEDILAQAYNAQRAANVRQLATALQMYHLNNSSYPQVSGSNSQERWSQLMKELKNNDCLATFPTNPEKYDYKDFNSSQNYILRVLLEDSETFLLENDWDGEIEGINCQDPNYCLKM